jgi:steroid 5-alpha reductase family enzyme
MMIQILVFNALLLMGTALVLWAIAVRIRDVSHVDCFWAFGMVLMAVSTFIQLDESTPRGMLILVLTSLWGVRLGVHLFFRWRREGADPRYTRILGDAMATKGWSFAKASLLIVFLLQTPLLFIVCLPAQIGQMAAEPTAMGWTALLGAALALTGIAFESIGDRQLRQFRANPANAGKVLESGLWRYTRHPNYFGDACTWWGIWLIAAETVPGRWTVIGPLFLSWTLIKWSGVPMLERGMGIRRPDYVDYIRRTSGFVPWWPRD